MDLNDAEVAVTTQHILDGKEYKDYWVQMSDYSDMGEFLCACSDLFPEEEDPEYRYTRWEHWRTVLNIYASRRAHREYARDECYRNL